jgi:hypothetical protein
MAEGPPTSKTLRTALAIVAVIGILLLTADASAGVAILLLSLSVSFFALMARRITFDPKIEVTVGEDGMLVRRRGGSGFFAWSEIEDLSVGPDVERSQRGPALFVVWKGGARERVGALVGSASEARALVKHARRLRASYAARTPVAAAASLPLARDGRAAADWLNGVRALRVESPDYRSADVDDEILWSVVEDPRADPTARVGAAAALVAERDQQARARLRVAAEASAMPQLRETLDAIASAEAEDDVTLALHRLR